jgi:sarcosine oxidase subunit alpha
MFPAGFYYKTFMWPAKAWMFYERFIRKAGGLGSAPEVEDTASYVQQNVHCDVFVAGGGIAGLAAALSAARSGARVIVAELGAHLGGSAHRVHGTIDGLSASAWVRAAQAELAAMPEVRIIQRGVVFGYHDHNFLTVRESLTDHLPLNERKGFRERMWRVRAHQVILATGAHERPMVFGNNDLPGVMLSSAMADYLQLYGVLVGKKIVLLTNNDSAYADALTLKAAGAQVTVVDARSADVPSGGLLQQAREAGVDVLRGFVPLNASGSVGVRDVTVCQMVGDKATGNQRVLACDALGMAGGWNPAIHLYSHSGGKAQWNDAQCCFQPGVAMPNQSSVGSAKPRGLWRKPYPRPAAPAPKPRNKRAFQLRRNRSLFKNPSKNRSPRFGLLRQAFRFRAAPRRLLITKMTSVPVTLSWRCAKVSNPSNTSSVTPPWVLEPTKVS